MSAATVATAELHAAFAALVDATPHATDAEIVHQFQEKFPELFEKYRRQLAEIGLEVMLEQLATKGGKRLTN